jgi:hypothetical protein
LSFSAKNITLSDTVPITPEFSNSIKNGQFLIIADNGFPLSATIELAFLDKTGKIIDVLTSPTAIQEASLDPITGRVRAKQKSRLTFALDETRIHNFQNTENMIFKVKFDTKPEGKFVKLFTDYAIDFKVVGDVTYKIQ